MPFPISSAGTISVDNADLARSVAAVEERLVQAKTARVQTSGGRIAFQTGFFASSWDFLGSISSGTLSFQQAQGGVEVHYRLSHVGLLVMLIISIVTPLALVLIWGWSPARIAVIPLAFWPFIYGMSYFYAPRRFATAVKTAIENDSAAHPSHGSSTPAATRP